MNEEDDDDDIQIITPVEEKETDEEPVIDITINNVVCSFSVGCHLDLRNIALNGHNVEFRKENGVSWVMVATRSFFELRYSLNLYILFALARYLLIYQYTFNNRQYNYR